MRLRIGIAALALIATTSFGAAQTDSTPPGGTASPSPSDQTQAPPEASDIVTVQWDGGPTGGAPEPMPLSPRGDNTAYSPTVDEATDK